MTKTLGVPPPAPRQIVWIRVCRPCCRGQHDQCGGDCQCVTCEPRNRAEGQYGTNPSPRRR